LNLLKLDLNPPNGELDKENDFGLTGAAAAGALPREDPLAEPLDEALEDPLGVEERPDELLEREDNFPKLRFGRLDDEDLLLELVLDELPLDDEVLRLPDDRELKLGLESGLWRLNRDLEDP